VIQRLDDFLPVGIGRLLHALDAISAPKRRFLGSFF
jgi:hypothetical protein